MNMMTGSQQSQPGGDDITPAPPPHQNAAAAPKTELRDKATDFLQAHGGDGNTSFTYEEERAVLRRIDMRILPLLLGAYFFQQLDKSSLRCVALLTYSPSHIKYCPHHPHPVQHCPMEQFI
jgi:hypothetical protein